MASKQAKVREPYFMGKCYELKSFLNEKKKSIRLHLKRSEDGLTKKQKDKVSNYIDLIDSVLDLKYFTESALGDMTMAELIEDIKLERELLEEPIEEAKMEMNAAKAELDGAFAITRYLSNKYDGDYDSPEQINLRSCIAEYQAAQYEHEKLELERTVYWWLLGIICRPQGFFEKVFEE